MPKGIKKFIITVLILLAAFVVMAYAQRKAPRPVQNQATPVQ